MENKKFTAKGKKMFNILINKFGKKKARSVFYSMERNHPNYIKGWREETNNEVNKLCP